MSRERLKETGLICRCGAVSNERLKCGAAQEGSAPPLALTFLGSRKWISDLYRGHVRELRARVALSAAYLFLRGKRWPARNCLLYIKANLYALKTLKVGHPLLIIRSIPSLPV